MVSGTILFKPHILYVFINNFLPRKSGNHLIRYYSLMTFGFLFPFPKKYTYLFQRALLWFFINFSHQLEFVWTFFFQIESSKLLPFSKHGLILNLCQVIYNLKMIIANEIAYRKKPDNETKKNTLSDPQAILSVSWWN